MTEAEIAKRADAIPANVQTDRQDIVDIVEWWVNAKHGGDATVDEIAAAVIHALAAER